MKLFQAILSTVFLAFMAQGAHVCERTCVEGEVMNCEYEFTMEWYGTMSKACYECPFNLTDCAREDCIAADGFERSVIVVNRQLPGPAISVCEGDTISVKVRNHLANGEGTAIHWHGLYQRDSQWMDGVPMLTQCPIPAYTYHQYQFRAEPYGTHWWHAHAGFHRGDGSAGPLIIRQAARLNAHKDLYDVDSDEHIMLIGDWLHQTTMDKFVMHHHSNGNNKGEGMLINGKGVFTNYTDSSGATHVTPMSEFVVDSNLRYRFRVISNAVVFCPMQVSIDQHNLTVISSDGQDMEPIEVSSVTLHGGERYDFVVKTDQPPDSYWVRVQGVADCVNQSQKAILRYSSSASGEIPVSESGTGEGTRRSLNGLHHTETEDGEVAVHAGELRGVGEADQRLRGEPDQVVFLGFDFKKVDNELFHRPGFYPIATVPRDHHLYTPQINNVTFASPDRPLLYQFDEFDSEQLCDPEQKTDNFTAEFRSCVHTVKVASDKLIELVIYDEGFTFDAGHPMHLHGQHFALVAMDRVNTSLSRDEMKRIHSNGTIAYELERPVMKDTVIVPDGGYVVLRFFSDNPGFWALHCHLSFHLETGMMLVMQVGEPQDMRGTPSDYPRCGSYKSNGSSALTSSLALVVVTCLVTWFSEA